MKANRPEEAGPMTQNPVTDAKIEQLDSFGAILPLDRAEQLASLLSDDDIETLRHFGQSRHGRKIACVP